MIYIFIPLIILCMYIITIYIHNKKINKFLYLSLIIFLILFSGLRYKTGVDWDNYMMFYSEFSNIRFEAGYKIVIYLLRELKSPYFIKEIIFSFFSMSMLNIFMKKYKINYSHRILFLGFYYFYFYLGLNMGLERMLLACLIGWYSLTNTGIKKIFFIIISIFFHKSALILLLDSILKKILKSNLVFFSLQLFLVILYYLNFNFIFKALEEITESIDYLKNYSYYFKNYIVYISRIEKISLLFLIGFFAFLISLFLKKIENDIATRVKIYFLLKWISFNFVILWRITIYYEIFLIIYYIYYFENKNKEIILLYLYGMCLYFLGFFTAKTIEGTPNYERYIPYNNIFKKESNEKRESLEEKL